MNAAARMSVTLDAVERMAGIDPAAINFAQPAPEHDIVAQLRRVEAALSDRDAMEFLDLTVEGGEFEARYFAVREEAVELSRIAYAHRIDLHLVARALAELPGRAEL